MPSPPILDIAKLTAPIPGANPAGEPVAHEIKAKLEDARKEVDPNNWKPDDPMRPKDPKKADWKGILQTSQQVLATSSKDLLIAARLTEALLKEFGYAGLRDGLQLLQKLIEDCWDRLSPPIEDNDLDIRSGPFLWLDDPDRGARFPNSLRMVPVFFFEGKRYSLMERRTSLEGKGPLPAAEFEKVIQATPVVGCRQALEDLVKCREHLGALVPVLQKRIGGQAPALTSLRPVVDECLFVLQEIVNQKAPPAAPAVSGPAGDPAVAPTPGGAAGPAARASRADIYRQLSQAAAALKELEPHSPIPYFIQRAVELGKLAFPDLIKTLVREEKILKDLNRELGIEEDKPAKK